LFKELKHIAISLLLVFIIPIIYQPVHIVRHHSNKKHDCSHGICRVVKNPGAPVVQKNEHCFICEYEFTVTNLPDEFDIPFVEAFVGELMPAKIQDIFSFEVILHTSPRAPPFYA
jgi:hypothetical protein